MVYGAGVLIPLGRKSLVSSNLTASAEGSQMAFDEGLAARVRDELQPYARDLAEIKMFGGLCFTIRGNMVVGVEAERLMIRFDKARADEILAKPHVAPMDFTGKVMNGFGFVAPAGYRTDKQLRAWIELCAGYVDSLPPKKPKKRKPPVPKA